MVGTSAQRLHFLLLHERLPPPAEGDIDPKYQGRRSTGVEPATGGAEDGASALAGVKNVVEAGL